jgi:hypothetical protein
MIDWKKTIENAGIILVLVIFSIGLVVISTKMNAHQAQFNATGHLICTENNLTFVSATNSTLICEINNSIITPHYNMTYPAEQVLIKVDWNYYNNTEARI